MVGRIFEQNELKRAVDSNESEFIMIYGRRRVGKTFLIREFFHDNFVFSCTGIAKGDKEEELMNFRNELARRDESTAYPVFRNWMEAFNSLRALVERSQENRKVIFLDETPWMYTQKSDFLKALEHFWNNWACSQHNIILIVCGSAASWMVKKMIRDKGGLHDRVTLPLRLLPFTLSETKEYLLDRGIDWDYKTIAECYMILGGIPYYLKLLDKRFSLAQNIDRLFFTENAFLKSEFENLYSSLFRNSNDYIKIVEILSRKKMGYTRDEIVTKGKFKDGGNISEKLEDLEECGFIRKYSAKGDVGNLFQLADFYTLFYFQFIKKGSFGDEEFWMHTQGTARHDSWAGLSFERLCFSHLYQIKNALGVSGISTKAYAYYGKGFQIDMILERADRHVNILEIKYSDGPFSVSKKYAAQLEERKAFVEGLFKKRMSFSTVLLTVDGVKADAYSSASVQRILTIDCLF